MGVTQYALCNHIKGTAIYRGTKYLWDVSHSRAPRLMYVSGCPGHQNLGDEALFEACKKLFNRCSLVHYSGGRTLSIPSKLLKISGTAMLAGGTIINRMGLHAARECIDVFAKLFVFGTGVAQPAFWSGKVGRKDTLKQWKPILQRCGYVGVRGPLSAQVLREIGIDNVEVIGDPVLTFASNNYKNWDSHEPNSIGLNVGWDRIAQWGEPETIYAEYIQLASIARKARWRVRWFVVWPPDLATTTELAKISDTEAEIYQIYSNPSEYIELVRPLSIFVGTRLHSVALATCAYVPSIMLEYRPKCRDYMMSIGQEHNTIRTDKFKAKDVWNIVNACSSKRELLSKALYQSIKPMRDKQCRKAEELMKGLSQ